MYPILFSWGPFIIPSWHAFYAIGALAAYGTLLLLSKRLLVSISSEVLSQFFVVCYTAGYFGARFLSILVEEPHVSGLKEVLAALVRFGPMTFYGGAVGAYLAGSIFCYFRKVPYGYMLDLGCIAGFLALAIGRVGCFLNGDDYGKPMTYTGHSLIRSLGVTFPVLEDGIPRWPVQLFESLGVFALVFALAWIKLRLRPRSGLVGLITIICYANLRFMLEFLRDDFRGFVFGTWLSTSQFIALLTLAISGVVALIWLVIKPKAFPVES